MAYVPIRARCELYGSPLPVAPLCLALCLALLSLGAASVGDDDLRVDSEDNLLFHMSVPAFCSSDTRTWSVVKLNPSGSAQWTVQNESCEYRGDPLLGIYLDSENGVVLAGIRVYKNWSSFVHVRKFSSSGTWQWSTERGLVTRVSGVSLDSNDSTIVVGTTSDSLDGQSPAGSTDVFIMKFSSFGTWLWTAMRGSSAQESLKQYQCIRVDSHDNILIAGETKGALDGQSSSGTTGGTFVMKFSTFGTWLWTAQRALPVGYSFWRVFMLDSNDDVLMWGSSIVMKLDNMGNWLWSREMEDDPPYYYYYGAVEVFETNVVCFTYVLNYDIDTPGYGQTRNDTITMLDSSGQTLYAFEAPFHPQEIKVDSRGNILLVRGESSEQYAGGYKMLVAKFTNGSRQWMTEWGSVYFLGSPELVFDSNDHLLMAFEDRLQSKYVWQITKLSSGGSLQWTRGSDDVEASSLPQCTPDFFGPLCDMKAFQFESYEGLCLDRAQEPLCKGIVFAASRDHWWRCSGTAECDAWFSAKETIQIIYEAELSDLVVDFLSAFFGITLACLTWRGEGAWKSRWFVPMASMVCFLTDIALESIVVATVTNAATIFSDYQESFCFSQGDGYATIVKLEDLTGTIAQLASINIGVAIFGGLCDIVQVFRDSREGLAASAVILTNLAAVCELVLGGASFFMNTLQFVDELESIEKAALNIEALDAGHVCYSLPNLLLPATAVGMEWVAPLLVIIPTSVVFLCFLSACCCVCCGGRSHIWWQLVNLIAVLSE